jgi:hypothetical protein
VAQEQVDRDTTVSRIPTTNAILSYRKIYLVGIIIDLGKNLVRISATGQKLGLT